MSLGDTAQSILKSEVIWDAHSGFMPDPAADLNNLRIWREAGVDYLSIDVGFDLLPWEKTVGTLAYFRHWILARPADYALVSSTDEILAAKAQGKLAVTFDIEGMNALNGRVEMVEFYHRLGVRQRHERAERPGRNGRVLPPPRRATDAFRLQPQQPRRRRVP